MGISTKLIGKQILEAILSESNCKFGSTKIKNIDYLINENIGIKVVVRNRETQKIKDDTIYEKISSINGFDNACKENDLLPYYCIAQILENNINVLLFSLQKAREEITNSGLNINIKESSIKNNECIFDGVLWRLLRKEEIFINDKFIKGNAELIYVGEDVALYKKLFYIDEIAETIEDNPEVEKEDNLDDMDINSLKDLGTTEKEQLVKSRIGQGKLKELLIKKDCKCKICGLNDERFLIASHIQRWAESNDNERRDTNNAFLLCSDHDWLFDKFYISFDDAGNISLNDSLDKVIYENLKISKDLNNISLNSENKKYMKWHRKEFYKKNNI
ncbi:HNH endonuclease [Clostridium beijerinckii]|jgi:hypothetical protein|uniref:HNH nuclease domain-containing protein n=2 Tax=Clostridium beijerinckii TaxID=1520 RepID=A6LR77_CLOB8|nr:HNH endonuclease [Clostridium beijerinckii]ABR32857.1 hypothetical protein Cbei_0670 [Clostridium beijerinckii NCIMB 8052]AIU01316.1 hypothetical protein Cbs_0670 [Clostridium beijerinckii ATCC 35702]NOW88097.1 hypothetical protein [Clostridium beijerinckii]NRT25903.1 hypothetical protein [Clostridium beijerinckii]NRT66497.1 hypothetical protein [Clostridium beijerinckii]